MIFKQPLATKLDDEAAERVRRSHADAIVEAQGRPAMALLVIAGVALVDSTVTPIAHQLGRLPVWVRESAVRGASTTGRIEEIRSDSTDRTKFVLLKATGWGATITVDVVVL